jgi:hypothetical protein
MVLRSLAVLLILRVLAAILANYPDYFPPDFDSLFLQGREATFTGAYLPAFYVHIFSGSVVLFNGLILMSESVRRDHGGVHRFLGRAQVVVLLLFLLLESRQGKAVRLLITVGKQADHYQLREIFQDFGPDCRAFELTKEAPDAQPYAVLVNGSQAPASVLVICGGVAPRNGQKGTGSASTWGPSVP